jgi:flagellar M-ring protein FliF
MLLLGLVRPALRQPKPVEPLLPPPGTQLDAVVDDPQALPELDGDALAAAAGSKIASPLLIGDSADVHTMDQLRALAKEKPAVVAEILRGWFNKKEA